ncbi:MAG: hypothetical protein WCK08_02330 [Betaproteobacteria bacterium]
MKKLFVVLLTLGTAAAALAVDYEGSFKSDKVTLKIATDKYGEMFVISSLCKGKKIGAPAYGTNNELGSMKTVGFTLVYAANNSSVTVESSGAIEKCLPGGTYTRGK